MNAVYDHGHHGNALLSCFPIDDTHNHDVSDHAYEQRGILHCVLKTDKCPVHCYVVHLGLFESGRGRQTAGADRGVNKSAPNGEPVIIAGDFNDWRNTLSDKLRKELGVVEVFDELGTRLHAGRPGAQPGRAPSASRHAGAHLPGRAALVPPRPHLCARLQGRHGRKCCMVLCGPSCRTTRRSSPTCKLS